MKRTPKADGRAPKPPTRMIGLRVPQEEFDRLRSHADEDDRSIAAFARILMNLGWAAYLRERTRRK